MNATLRRLMYVVCLLAAHAFLAVLIWAHAEARILSNTLHRDRTLHSLRCFPLATAADREVFARFTVRNPLNEPRTRYVIVHIPRGSVLLVQQSEQAVPLPPKSARTLYVALVPARDRIYNVLIAVAVMVQRSYPLPGEVGSCGILYLPVPGIPGPVLGFFILAAVLVFVTGDLALSEESVHRVLDDGMAAGYILMFFFNLWAVVALLWLALSVVMLWAALRHVFGVAME